MKADSIEARIYDGYCEHINLTSNRPDKLILGREDYHELLDNSFLRTGQFHPSHGLTYMGMSIIVDNSLDGLILIEGSCLVRIDRKAKWEAKGWEHLQYVDGKLWGIPPGAVMPIPVKE